MLVLRFPYAKSDSVSPIWLFMAFLWRLEPGAITISRLAKEKAAGALLLLATFVNIVAEEEGLELLQEYVNRLNTKLCEALQGVLDAETELAEAVNLLEPSELQGRPVLIEMAETLPRLHEVIMPSADFESQQTLTLEKLIGWADRLEQAPQFALLCSLSASRNASFSLDSKRTH
jgi:hypothetical protein